MNWKRCIDRCGCVCLCSRCCGCSGNTDGNIVFLYVCIVGIVGVPPKSVSAKSAQDMMVSIAFSE